MVRWWDLLLLSNIGLGLKCSTLLKAKDTKMLIIVVKSFIVMAFVQEPFWETKDLKKNVSIRQTFVIRAGRP